MVTTLPLPAGSTTALAPTTLNSSVLDTSRDMEATFRCWLPPVNAEIRDGFEQPDCPYCAGRRAIVFANEPDEPVRAPAPGTVRFDGVVLGKRYVTMSVGSGPGSVLVTIGGLDLESISTRQGIRLRAGEELGSAAHEISMSVRIRSEDATYLDPSLWLEASRYRARLIPNGNVPARTARVRNTCGRVLDETAPSADSVFDGLPLGDT